MAVALAKKPKKARKVTKPKSVMKGKQTGSMMMVGPTNKPAYQPADYTLPGAKPQHSAPPAPTGPAAASVPTQAIKPLAPLATLEGLNTRTGAHGAYTTQMADVNRQLMQAALRFGGAPSVVQFGSQYTAPQPGQMLDPNNPFAGLADTTTQATVAKGDPLSAVSVIGSNYDKAIKGVQEGANAENTFFSSRRLQSEADQGKTRDDAIAQAKRDYEDAVAQLTAMLLGARGERDTAFRTATQGEIDYAAQKAPEAEAETAPPKFSAPAAPKKTATKKPAPKKKSKKKPKRKKKR